MFVGVVGMCILGYFAIKPLCKVLDAPEALVSAFVVVFCFIGAFAARSNLSDLYVIAAFGLVGFLFERFKFPFAPMVLGTILGPLTENAFMTTMVSFNNDWTVFFTRPIRARSWWSQSSASRFHFCALSGNTGARSAILESAEPR